MNIRLPNLADLPHIAPILEDTELFPMEMLEQMISPFLEDPNGDERWLVCERDSSDLIGFCYCRAEPLTEGTWNLLAIGFRADQQGRGYGGRLLAHVEQALADQRVLIIETSGLDEFQATRDFYTKHGYDREAVIRDFWAPGDDKVIYWKALG